MAYVIIAVCFGLAGGIVGRIKGSSFLLWFLISGAVPFFGLLAALAYRFDRDELRRQCPNCGRVTKIYDALCTRCGTELDFPETAIVPESAGALTREQTPAGT
ncbi:MAG TPA: hypothetical protein VHT25_03255 [Solirubrobacteraceae bacterium]|jgi:hypothetical protein|nr:hypothetical protein [Solirubrobacteraceae bacterium]